jgi:hypothetical protein
MLYHKKIGDEVHGEENFNNELQACLHFRAPLQRKMLCRLLSIMMSKIVDMEELKLVQ